MTTMMMMMRTRTRQPNKCDETVSMIHISRTAVL